MEAFVSCISRILELKGNKDHLHVIRPDTLPACFGIVVEGGGEYKGHHYLITFTGAAHRCGYVALPEGHPLANLDLQLVCASAPEPYKLDIHGGITFHETGIHILESLFPTETHCNDTWIGFDAAHFRDGKDWEYHEKYFGKDKTDLLSSCFNCFDKKGIIRTYKYMEDQCKYLIDQLIEKENSL